MNAEIAPVEVTTRYVTTVDELGDAWAFVMAHLDCLGPDPRIVVKPVWISSPLDMDLDIQVPRRFEVLVEGMQSFKEADNG